MSKKQTMQQSILMLLIIAVFAVFMYILYYYGDIYGMLTPTMGQSAIAFDALFVFICSVCIFFLAKEKMQQVKKITYILLFALAIVLLLFSMMQPKIFEGNTFLFINLRVATFIIESIIGICGCIAVINAYIKHSLVGQIKPYLVKKELKQVENISIWYVVLMLVLSFVILQEQTVFEKSVTIIGYTLTATVLAVVNYQYIKAKWYIKDERTIAKYRYLHHEKIALPQFVAEFSAAIIEEESNITKLREQLQVGEKQREEFLQIAADKPSVEQEVNDLTMELSTFDVEKLVDEKEKSSRKKEQVRNKLWKDHFNSRFVACKADIKNTEREIHSLRAEKTKNESEHTARTEHIKKETQKRDELQDELQAAQKQAKKEQDLYSALEKKLSKMSATERDATLESELQASRQQLEKAEKTVDDLEGKIEGATKNIETLQQENGDVQKSIADHQASLKNKEEALQELQKEITTIENDFTAMLNKNNEIQKLNQTLSEIDESLEIVSTLENKQQLLSEQLAINTDQEIAQIDGRAKDMLDDIAERTIAMEAISEKKDRFIVRMLENAEEIKELES